MAAAKLRTLAVFSLVLLCALAASSAASDGNRSGKGKKTLRLKKSVFSFYWHDKLDGARPTSVQVIPPVRNAAAGAGGTLFGMMQIIDNALTEGPKPNSKEIGRAQGLYAATACEQPMRVIMAQTLVFTSGKYWGSTLSLLGSNAVFSPTREMPVVGGTGLFRFASGFVQLKTHSFDNHTGDATVKYTVHVLHY